MFKAHDIAKRQHRERHQPSDRKKWGLLEKKKDYRQRAQDYHKKQAHLALLRSKAAQRNEDEFDYGMIRAKSKDGALVKERQASQALSNDAVKLLKTQDEGYIRTLENQERKKVERAKNGIILPNLGRHTVYVENEDEMQRWNAAEHFDTSSSSVGNCENRQRKGQTVSELSAEQERQKLDSLKEFKSRIIRQKELSKLRQEVDLQRELMKKGPKVKSVDSEGKVTYKWLNVRKR